MKTVNSIKLSAIACSIAFSTLAYSAMDNDYDTINGWQSSLAAEFVQLDTSGNGLLLPLEAAKGKAFNKKTFAAADADGDGTIDQAEYIQYKTSMGAKDVPAATTMSNEPSGASNSSNDHTYSAKAVVDEPAPTMMPAVDYVVAHASSVDLIITGATLSDFYEGPNYANAGGIVMQSGRPVLAVPVNAQAFKLDNMLVGWKESREARRAIADAIPLLKLATQVTVFEIVAKDHKEGAAKRLNDVVIWLNSHGVAAKAVISIATDTDAAQFISIAKKHHADIVITGAYGHSRFREWVLGGITNELLQNAQFNAFLSH